MQFLNIGSYQQGSRQVRQDHPSRLNQIQRGQDRSDGSSQHIGILRTDFLDSVVKVELYQPVEGFVETMCASASF
jgi:hypothetical protein